MVNNPLIDVGGYQPLKLALNTAQYGRVFQDRSSNYIILFNNSNI